MEKQKNSHGQKSEDINDLLRDNLRLNKEMHGMLRDIKRYILWSRAWTAIKIIIIVIPIILGIIYLPPMAKEWVNKYRSWFSWGQTAPSSRGVNEDIQKIDREDMEAIKEGLTQEQIEMFIDILQE
jgi:hypothetical protein